MIMTNLESALAGIEQRINSPRAYPGWALDAERLLKALRAAVEQRNSWMEASLRVRSDGFEKIEDSKLAAILANGREGF